MHPAFRRLPGRLRRPTVGRSAYLLVAGLATGLVAGCGSQPPGPELQPVSGQVLLDDAPVADATVLFQPEGPETAVLPAQAVTDAAGRFTMTTHVGGGTFRPGLPAGTYRVAVTKLERPPGEAALTRPPTNVLPAKYASPEASPWAVAVEAGQSHEFPLRLER
jgi:hypothetical protein